MAGTRKISEILSELITRRGYARESTAGVDHATWTAIAGGPFGKLTRVGEIKRGILEIVAANNMVISELGFEKQRILTELNAKLPTCKLRDLRFKVGKIAAPIQKSAND